MEPSLVYEPFTTSFGAVAARCQAKSKRSGVQCCKPAMRGKAVCRTHGGASTGARTQQGRERCAQAKTVHGWETREIRRKRAEKLRELRELEGAMLALGMIKIP
nr:HGGxSTG domain-containing protein [Yoonia sp.]